MYCKYCKNKINKGSKVCEKCGKENPIKKSKNKKVILIIIVLLISICCIKLNNMKLEQEKIKMYEQEVKIYEKEAEKYLTNTYNEAFDLKFVNEQPKTVNIMSINCGHSKNVNEYVFEYSPKSNDKIVCTIKVINETARDVDDKIYECYPLYEDVKKYYQQKIEIKDEVQKLLKDYSYYNVDLYNSMNTIYISTEKSLKNILSNDIIGHKTLYENIFNLLKDKNIYVEFEYKYDTNSFNYSIGNMCITQKPHQVDENGLYKNDYLYVKNVDEIIKNENIL